MEIIIGILGGLSIAVFVLLVTNSQSGWRRLAEAYQSPESSKSMHWRFVSARMGRGASIVPYRAALNIGADAAGLYLSLFPLFRLGAPPLFIPWDHLSITHEGMAGRDIEFRFREAPGVFLRLGKALSEEILKEKKIDNTIH